jgi:rhomboid protease GluP
MNRGMNKIKKETPKMFKKNMTNVLLYINVFVYLVNLVFPSSRYALMKIDQLISRGEQYRLLSSCIVHGSLIHLGFNMYSLYNTGPYIEKIFGPERFTTFYILSGVLANIGTYIIRSSPYALGASGCIYGILGALTTYFYRNREYLYDAEAR